MGTGACKMSEEWLPGNDPESGRLYYYNPVTHETRWTDEHAAQETMSSHEPAPAENPEEVEDNHSMSHVTAIDIGSMDCWVHDPKVPNGDVQVEKACREVFNDVMRSSNGLRWAMFQFDPSSSWIIPVSQCRASRDKLGEDWASFVEHLPPDAPAYMLYNFECWELEGKYFENRKDCLEAIFKMRTRTGSGKNKPCCRIAAQIKSCLYHWAPIHSPQKLQSGQSLRAMRTVCRVSHEAAINDLDELTWEFACNHLGQAPPTSTSALHSQVGGLDEFFFKNLNELADSEHANYEADADAPVMYRDGKITVEKGCRKLCAEVRRVRNNLRWGMIQLDSSGNWTIPVAKCTATERFGTDW